MAQGYNKYNYLQRVKAVCEIYMEHRNKGVTVDYIFRNYIAPRFFISR